MFCAVNCERKNALCHRVVVSVVGKCQRVAYFVRSSSALGLPLLSLFPLAGFYMHTLLTEECVKKDKADKNENYNFISYFGDSNYRYSLAKKIFIYRAS